MGGSNPAQKNEKGGNSQGLSILGKLIAHVHLKKQVKKAVINGDGKSQRPHQKNIKGI